MNRRILFLVPLALAIAAGAYFGLRAPRASAAPTAEAPPTPSAPVAEVQVRTLAPTLELPASLVAVEHVDLRARVPGVVRAIHVPEGGQVRRGQLLFELDASPFRAALSQAQAELRSAERTHELAEIELQRARRLAQDDVLAQGDLDALEASEGQARARVDAARALARARSLELGYTRIVSPIDGWVGEALVEAGNLVSGGSDAATLLAHVVSLDRLHVAFDVDEPTYLRLIARGRDARAEATVVSVELAGEQPPRSARVDYLSPTLDPRSGTARVRALLDNRDGLLGPGVFVRVRMPVGDAREVVLVDESVVHTDSVGRYVLVVDDEGEVTARHVTLAERVDGLRVVADGLSRGERVVVGGAVRPGMVILPRPVASASTTSTPEGGV